MTITEATPKYFAIISPDNPERMTYWHRNARGTLDPHPSQAKYGPLLYSKGDHEHIVPAELKGPARQKWVHAWFDSVRRPWLRRVHEAVEADLANAAVTFGRMAGRCCICGRVLTDPTSKCYGVGPECGKGLDGDVLAWLNQQLGRAHAAYVNQQ